MSLALSTTAVPTFKSALKSLKHIVGKAAEHAETSGIDQGAFLELRLFPDMFTFARQVQIVTDLVRRAGDRLIGNEPSSVEDNETSFEELIARIDSTLVALKARDAAAIDAAEEREILINLRGNEFKLSGRAFVDTFVAPNLFFHLSTAYNILRSNGVPLGKRDYLGAFLAT